MAAIVWNDVTALAPELTGVSVNAQTMILAYVNDAATFKVADWRGESSTFLKLGRCYLAAHFGAVSLQGAGGAVSSESAGGLSRSYAITPEKLNTTAYGQTFSNLARQASGGGVVL